MTLLLTQCRDWSTQGTQALAPSPHGRGRGVKVAVLPAPTQWRRRGRAGPEEKPLTLALSQWERGHGHAQMGERRQVMHARLRRWIIMLVMVWLVTIPMPLLAAEWSEVTDGRLLEADKDANN